METSRKPQRIVLAVLLAAIGCVLLIGSSSCPNAGRNGRAPSSRQARRIGLFTRALKSVLLLLASWCVMTFVHESGHILCGWACGGTLKTADLVSWHLPYSIFDPDPRPLVTLWGGPVLGAAIPLAVAILVRRDWMWFVANFCILANGVYLAAAWVSGDSYLDTPQLLEHGAQPAAIAVYCLVTIGFGYAGLRRQCVRAISGFCGGDR